ncbi:MAG: IPT/TIG domain-containing protein [Verrucomicrobiota bacterium]
MSTHRTTALIPSLRDAALRFLTPRWMPFVALLAAGFTASAEAQSRPTITSFTPTQGSTTTVVTITGTNFNRDINGNLWSGTAPYTVQFGASGGATPTFISSTQIRATVPNNGTTGPIRLRAFGAGQLVICQSPTNFTLTQVTRPAITSFSPASGPVGTQITIDGTNFNRTSTGTLWSGTPPYRVEFFSASGQRIEATPTFVSNTRIRVTVPSTAGAGQSPLRLRQNGVTFNTSNSSFTVTAPSTLRLVNNVQYNIVSLTLNGQQMFSPGNGVPIGSTVNVPLSPGTYSLVAGVGFVNAGVRDIWFTFSRTVTITSGQTNIQAFSRITVGQLLTLGTNSSTWIGNFFDNNGALHQARFVFSSTGGWQFFVDGLAQGTGAVTEVSWLNSSANVTFRINSSFPDITIPHPFGRFLFRNGPPSWPVIEYVKQ